MILTPLQLFNESEEPKVLYHEIKNFIIIFPTIYY